MRRRSRRAPRDCGPSASASSRGISWNGRRPVTIYPSGNSPIPFGERLAGSAVFRDLFREGMALVEETAAYLDGDGRVESRVLTRSASLAYTTVSMRLTTRLMQLASWLLLQRALHEGQISSERATREKLKVKLTGAASPTDGPEWTCLPDQLRMLVLRSLRLQERIRRLDEAVANAASGPAPNPVALQRQLIADAFARGPSSSGG